MTLFLTWLKRAHKGTASVTEELVYAYLSHVRSIGAPPSRAQSFIEALRFSAGVIGLSLSDNFCSARVRGVAARSLAAAGTRKQAPPLSVAAVCALESMATTAGDLDMRYAAGFLCFLVHARARAAEAARTAGPLTADFVLSPDGAVKSGYVEVLAHCTKTATGKRRRLALPLVALACGVSPVDDCPLGSDLGHNTRPLFAAALTPIGRSCRARMSYRCRRRQLPPCSGTLC